MEHKTVTKEQELLNELDQAQKDYKGLTNQTNWILVIIAKALIEIAAQLEATRLNA